MIIPNVICLFLKHKWVEIVPAGKRAVPVMRCSRCAEIGYLF